MMWSGTWYHSNANWMRLCGTVPYAFCRSSHVVTICFPFLWHGWRLGGSQKVTQYVLHILIFSPWTLSGWICQYIRSRQISWSSELGVPFQGYHLYTELKEIKFVINLRNNAFLPKRINKVVVSVPLRAEEWVGLRGHKWVHFAHRP